MSLDYTNFGEKGPRESLTGNEDRRWWTLEGVAAADSISSNLKRMRDQQTARLTQFTVAARLYGNLSVFAIAGQAAARYAQQYALMKERISYNVVQSAVDTVTAKMAKNRPRPYFLTSSGNYEQQRKAQKLNKFIEGVFYEENAYQLGIEAFRDGAVAGDGIIHVYGEGGRVKYERVLATELWVDEQEGIYGQPRQMHRTKTIDKHVLMSLAEEWADGTKEQKKFEEAIDAAETFKAEGGARLDNTDLIEVRESWHLPDGPDAKKDSPRGGRHMITIAGHVLLAEPWLRDHFPFARFRWSPRIVGYWSQGGAEQIQQIQFEVNKLMGVIQRSFELAGTFKILLESSSKVPVEHLNNRLGTIVKYTGTPPQYVTPPAVQAEIFNHLLTLKNAAFEQFGISQLSATSQKPAGLNSGVALREYNDIETDRFQTVGKAYEQLYLDLADLTIETAKEMGLGYRVKVPGKRALEEVRFELPDEWVMQCFPVSSLPRDPAGRLQTIQEYMQAGLLTPRQGKKLLDFPDLDRVEDLTNAAENYLSETLDSMLDGGPFIGPEPEDDLQLAQEMCLEYFAYAKSQHADPDRLEMLRRFMSQIDVMMKTAAAAAAPQQPQQPAPPQASPEAAPTSNLLPNAPGLQAAA